MSFNRVNQLLEVLHFAVSNFEYKVRSKIICYK